MGKGTRKVIAGCLIFSMVISLLIGCGKDTDSESGKNSSDSKKLEVITKWTQEELKEFQQIVKGFTEETGIEVEIVAPGGDYESIMKTRMASGNLPDVFETHGWSIIRYSEYLTPLNDEEWIDRIDEAMLDTITDEAGNIYVLPVSQTSNGIIYNKTVLEESGVAVEELLTMDDFLEACEKIKAAGFDPIYVGGKDVGQLAGLYNGFAPTYFCTEGCLYPSADAFKDGTFDWDANGKHVLEELVDWLDKGYFNADYATADGLNMQHALGSGDAAFLLCGSSVITSIKRLYYPDAELGFLPVPSTGNGQMAVQIGEGTCFGIWNESEHMDEAKAYLDYLARPEVAMRINAMDGALLALEGMEEGETDTYKEYKAGCALFEGKGVSICYDNVWDREYMPSGMWPILMDAMAELFASPDKNGIEAARVTLKENFIEKFAIAQ